MNNIITIIIGVRIVITTIIVVLIILLLQLLYHHFILFNSLIISLSLSSHLTSVIIDSVLFRYNILKLQGIKQL